MHRAQRHRALRRGVRAQGAWGTCGKRKRRGRKAQHSGYDERKNSAESSALGPAWWVLAVTWLAWLADRCAAFAPARHSFSAGFGKERNVPQLRLFRGGPSSDTPLRYRHRALRSGVWRPGGGEAREHAGDVGAHNHPRDRQQALQARSCFSLSLSHQPRLCV